MKPIDLPKLPAQSALRGVVLAMSSVLGLGYLPLAPGTWGTLAALPIWWAWADYSMLLFVALTAVLGLMAIAIASAAETIYGTHDVGRIVIDEVVGLLCTVIGVPWRWPEIIAAFVLFRCLDAFKPPPIRWFDRHVPGGFGVVIDDVVAGLLGCLLLHSARLAHGGWW